MIHVREFSPAIQPARMGGTATPGHFPSGVLAPPGVSHLPVGCGSLRGPSHRRALQALGRVHARTARELGA